MKKIMLIFGTRPEAIKMCPLVIELKQRENIKTSVCVSGQHREMLDSVLDAFGVTPDYDLSIMRQGQSLLDITSGVLEGIYRLLERERPDVALVHGDTSTAFAAALACFYAGVEVGHVEAGLRTYKPRSPYPEEFNRRAIALIAKYHFAPTERARENLLCEGCDSSSVFVTGNTAIDALCTTVKENYSHPALEWARGRRIILLTAHRRENLGEPMRNIFRALRGIVEEYSDVCVIYPIHLNPSVRVIARDELLSCEKIRIIEPLGVLDFHNFMRKCYMIITDSGGIQEEAPALSRPVLVARDTTERPEGIEAGTLRLVGTDEREIYESVKLLLEDGRIYESMARAKNPYGDGFASRRIADILEQD